MSVSNNRKCLLCGKTYSYCPQCGHKEDDLWKITFCSKNCRDIFQTCVDFNLGAITVDEAKEKLSTLNLSERDTYNSTIKSALDKIFPIVKPVENNDVKKNYVNNRIKYNKYNKKNNGK